MTYIVSWKPEVKQIKNDSNATFHRKWITFSMRNGVWLRLRFTKENLLANKLVKLGQMEKFSPSHPTASTPEGVWKVSLGIMRRKFISNEFPWIMTYLLGNGFNSRSRHNWAATLGAPTNELKNFRLNCEVRFNHSCRLFCQHNSIRCRRSLFLGIGIAFFKVFIARTV